MGNRHVCAGRSRADAVEKQGQGLHCKSHRRSSPEARIPKNSKLKDGFLDQSTDHVAPFPN
eukprot:3297660-Amphidinium_carterae.1